MINILKMFVIHISVELFNKQMIIFKLQCKRKFAFHFVLLQQFFIQNSSNTLYVYNTLNKL